MPTWYYALGSIIAIIGLGFAIKNYHRKSGLLIRGIYSISTSIDCDDAFVSKIILENLKDRAVTIFAIYLKVGPGYYIQLENFEDRPLLLKAYETYQKELGPVQFYGSNMHRVKLDHLLQDKKIRKRLVLSTGEGKYVVPLPIKRWNPVTDFFKNHLTAIIRPVHTQYKEKYIGANIAYIIEFIGENDHEEVVLVRKDDYKVKKFRAFNLTKESLETKETLENFLTEHIHNGNLSCKKFTVIDTEPSKARLAEDYSLKPIEIPKHNRFQYHVLGKFITWKSNRHLKIENAKLKQDPINPSSE